MLSSQGISKELIFENFFQKKYKELYKIRSFPHPLVKSYFFLKSCGKVVKKFYLIGEIFVKISNFIYLLIH